MRRRSSRSNSPRRRPTGWSAARSCTSPAPPPTPSSTRWRGWRGWRNRPSLEVHVPQWRFVGEHPGPGHPSGVRPRSRRRRQMTQLCEVAQAVRELMGDIGLTTYPSPAAARACICTPRSRSRSAHMARCCWPNVLRNNWKSRCRSSSPSTMTRSLREGKVFLDWSQNNASKTTIAPYSLRGREHPTVAAPRTWEEIDGSGTAASTVRRGAGAGR